MSTLTAPMLGRLNPNAGYKLGSDNPLRGYRPNGKTWAGHAIAQRHAKLDERIALAAAFAQGEHDYGTLGDFDRPFADEMSEWFLSDARAYGVDNRKSFTLNGEHLPAFFAEDVDAYDEVGLFDDAGLDYRTSTYTELLDALIETELMGTAVTGSVYGDTFDPDEIAWGFSVSTRPPGGVTGRPVPANLVDA